MKILDDLTEELRTLRFAPPVTHIYNPLQYARRPYELYLERYASRGKEAVFLGMNPGPWGMAQTGIPFGEVHAVRDWLGIDGPVGRPLKVHPKRPVQGFACRKSEVSGRRFWGWARENFGTPERFFSRFFVANYCPLLFLEESGRNRTPDRLPVRERKPLLEACDRALKRTIRLLSPRWVLGIGNFAEERARAALSGLEVEVGRISHPSPANPRANRGWANLVENELAALGIQV
ncbi:MAG: single-stranded DNA-binding protein [Deltaproteobacteria bacterium]|nr:single-stranded DNA-binding protein [Deltaproteobacteria bacterium]MBW2129165.1 single-stranded DNA-binding protein [Deltaproteobacteria bacterium]MBW2304184.1 single-stranded DNA-binding protein [Deltaproteobacteria bacterium]